MHMQSCIGGKEAYLQDVANALQAAGHGAALSAALLQVKANTHRPQPCTPVQHMHGVDPSSCS